MPTNRVQINTSSVTGYMPRETYNDVLVFARKQSPPTDVDLNQQLIYRRATDVADDLGDGSDAHVAAQALDAMGTSQYRVVAAEETTVTAEVLGDSPTTAVSSGTVANTPMSGNVDVAVSLDGTALDVTYTTATPPDADTTVPSGEAYVNSDTGEVVTGESTSGSGPGIEVDYGYVDWTSAFEAVDPAEIDIATMANVHCDTSYIGDMDALVTWGSGEYTHVTFATEDGSTYASDQAFLEAAQPIAAYTPSADASMTAHKSPDDVANYVAGLMATRFVWEDPSLEEEGFPGLSGEGINKSLIGAPETSGTFEGGLDDDAREHAGAMNVLESLAGTWVLSNDLTTVGASSAYRYLDRRRTEGFVNSMARAALLSLAVREDIPFNRTGRVLIHNALRNVLGRYETTSYTSTRNKPGMQNVTQQTNQRQQDSSQTMSGEMRSSSSKPGQKQTRSLYPRRGPFRELNIEVPRADDIPVDMRNNRIWGIIDISYVINGAVHRFQLDITQRTQPTPDFESILPGQAPGATTSSSGGSTSGGTSGGDGSGSGS